MAAAVTKCFLGMRSFSVFPGCFHKVGNLSYQDKKNLGHTKHNTKLFVSFVLFNIVWKLQHVFFGTFSKER